MKVMEIKLTQKQVAIINEEDFWLIKDFTWHAKKSPSGFYAVSSYICPIDKKYKKRYMHKLILKTDKMIDHINRNTLDNRKQNLRECNKQQNQVNSKRKKCKYKGITFRKGAWSAKISKQGKYMYIGSFLKDKDAALAYDQKAREMFGEFAYLNFPNLTDYSKLKEAPTLEKLIKGVTKKGKYWIARIQKEGTRIDLGKFNTKEEAEIAYKKAKWSSNENFE